MDIIHKLSSSLELCALVAERAKERRLAMRLRQIDVAAAAGVTLSTVKRFERDGRVAFDSVTSIAIALDAQEALLAIFTLPPIHLIDEAQQRRKPLKRIRRRS